MLRLLFAAVVVLAVWLHWRAAYTTEVRAALDDLPASHDILADLIGDLRDKRLAYRCTAVLADQRGGDTDSLREHVTDAFERIEHLERFAPIRRFTR